MFINRKEELNVLNERAESEKAEFIVLYGRRRVGKTELIDHFISAKNGIRLLARVESEKNNLDRFSNDLSVFFNDEFIRLNPFQNWDSFFSYLADKASKERVIIAIDEFPYIVDSNKSIPYILQDYWDRKFKHSKIMLILCGSSMAMMYESVLSHKSPLYGRRTGQIKVEPMKFSEAMKFYKKFSNTDCVYVYSILGGMPGYLIEFDDNKSIKDNLKDKFLRRDRFLFHDAEFVLKEELNEPKFYFSILRAIAFGKTKVGEIMNETGLSKGIIGKYLSVLNELDLIKREVPVTEKHEHKSRKGIYTLKDNYYKFWFRFVFPNIEDIERNMQEYLINTKISPNLDIFTSFIFEDICREYIWKIKKFNFEKVGKWWEKESEIDIVAINDTEKKILFGECKWSENVDPEKALFLIKEKAKLVSWNNDLREEHYIIFAKSFNKIINEKNANFVSLNEII